MVRARSQDTGSIQYFDEFGYLHFVRISDAKVIASRYSATVLNVRKDGFASKVLNEEETGLNTVVYARGGGRRRKTDIKYNLTLHFGTSDYLYQRLIVIFPSLQGRAYHPSSVQRFNHTFRQEVSLTARAQIMHRSGCSNFGCTRIPNKNTVAAALFLVGGTDFLMAPLHRWGPRYFMQGSQSLFYWKRNYLPSNAMKQCKMEAPN